MKSSDIILLQEHWLFKCQLQLLNEINEHYVASGKSVDYYDPILPIQIPRGYGGVAILWNRNIDHLVNELELGNERIKCIELNIKKPLLIVCVYLPCNGEKDNYHSFVDCIEQLQEIIFIYQNSYDIIIGGDFNENAAVKSSSKRSQALHTFIRENGFVTKDTGHTFIHPNGRDSSTIDFFLYKQCFEQNVIQISRQSELSENVSDHYPVTLSCKMDLTKSDLGDRVTSNSSTVRINWKRVDKEQYKSIIDRKISNCPPEKKIKNLNETTQTINTILLDSAKECAPQKKSKQKKPKLKVMTPTIHSAIRNKKKAYYDWKVNGRPNDPGNFYLMEKKLKTAELRRYIRTEVARKRNEDRIQILEARQSDTALFHRLIKKQRGQCQKFIDELHVGGQIYSQDNILNGWFEHFSNLATKKDNDNFDIKFLKMVEQEVKVIYSQCLKTDQDINPVTDNEIIGAINSLNRGKAPDTYGVTAEHVYYGGQPIYDVIKALVNNVLLYSEVPDSLKLGILNPIYKNKGNCKESQNYRGITITPVLTRILEAIIKARIKPVLLDNQHPYQRGFTENSSPMNCALLVEEFYRNNKDLNKPTYVAFMDVKSAFDVVVHPNLMRKLHNYGVTGHEWLIIDSLHRNSSTSVKWGGKLSQPYVNQQGVRQGGVLSADLFKVYDDGLLHRIGNSEKGAFIGDIGVQSPTCADDMTFLSNTASGLQSLIRMSDDSSRMDGYILQEVKSVVMKMDSCKDYPENESWTLGSKTMPVVNNTTHMGIHRSSTNQEMHNVEINIQKAKRTTYSLMGSGLHGENGLDPETAISLLQTYVFPVLFYGLEIIIPTGKALSTLDVQYKKLLKQILSIPCTTADPAVYLLSGLLPPEAMIHKRMFSLFGNITRLPETAIEIRLAKRQLEIKTFKSHSWFIAVKKLLIMYDLPTAEELLENPFGKYRWKKRFNMAVNKYWTDKIVSQSELYSSLRYLSKTFIVGKCHPAVKPYSYSDRDIYRIPVKNKILTGTYILQSNRAKFNQNEVNPTCQLCRMDNETIQHFLLNCKELDTVRKPILNDFLNIRRELIVTYPLVADISIVQLLIDASVINDCYKSADDKLKTLLELLHFHSRRLVYILHSTRYQKLELVPKSKIRKQAPAAHT
ncbi:MAG: reverse transcriptase domain-containing protein [Candidatus Thiodiazotropha endolucinida]|nr:endonuclease/exonuclease/phosphatase family protein [Candidatus Thiodiazotropha taylori]MCW4260814.1 reverse transcriptase domain-containing protein [Candidatus Thiodiazotropha endolucinida]